MHDLRFLVKLRGCRFLKDRDAASFRKGMNNESDSVGEGVTRYYEVDDFTATAAVEKMLLSLSSSFSS